MSDEQKKERGIGNGVKFFPERRLTMGKRMMSGVGALVALVVAWASPAAGFSVTNGDRDLDNNASYRNLVADNGTDTIVPDGNGVYEWAGTGFTGLLLCNSRLYTASDSQTMPFTLKLNGGDIISATDNVGLQTTNSQSVYGRSTGSISIQNVGAISIGAISTADVGNWSSVGSATIGADVAGQRAGHVRIGGIDTHTWHSDNQGSPYAGDVKIYGTGNVLIQTAGGEDRDILTWATHGTGASWSYSRRGAVIVRHHGQFQARDILAYGGTAGGIVNHVEFDGDILGAGKTGAFQVNNIYTYSPLTNLGGSSANGPGAVTIRNYTGMTLSGTLNGRPTYAGAGSIAIADIDGDVTLGAVDTHSDGLYSSPGTLKIDTRITGSITVNGAIDMSTTTAYDPVSPAGISLATSGGDILLKGNVDMSSKANPGVDAGSLTAVASAGSVTIKGAIDLHAAEPGEPSGSLSLTAGGSKSTITLASLDLSKVDHAALNAGRMKSYVAGLLAGFPTTTPADGKLDAPASQIIYYDPNFPGNSYLNSGIYPLKSGGMLVPGRLPVKGTVITFR